MSDFIHTAKLGDNLEATLDLTVEGRNEELHEHIDEMASEVFAARIKSCGKAERSVMFELLANGASLDEFFGEFTDVNYTETHTIEMGDVRVAYTVRVTGTGRSMAIVVGRLVDMFERLYGPMRH